MEREMNTSATDCPELPRRMPRLDGRPTVLLFYDGFELRLRPDGTGRVGSRLRGLARYVYRSSRRQQVWTGFYTAFRSLVVSLRHHGCDVRINDSGLARGNPKFPVGLAGYPSVLAAADLPNPRIFGPGDYGYPDDAAIVAQDPRNRILTQPSEWPVALYRAACGDKLRVMFVGIDTELWPDLSHRRKDLDFIVYDKIRWQNGMVRHDEPAAIVTRTTRLLDTRGLSYVVLRYGAHHLSRFRDALSRARGMIFLCEHETQGLAYQEALASNVPVLALDEGVLADPAQKRYAPPDFKVSSVPYFDAACGATFVPDRLDDALATFMRDLPRYRPRDYVLGHLSQPQAAANYLELYAGLA
jgi:glycosyltransferase involved in cell wall biosynthesis